VTRESWLNGWHRDGDSILGHCVGCGKYMGAAIGMRDDYPEKGPEWPFDVETCPVCELRDKVSELRWKLESPEDKLTARLAALRERAP
jgi:hypothetical protein